MEERVKTFISTMVTYGALICFCGAIRRASVFDLIRGRLKYNRVMKSYWLNGHGTAGTPYANASMWKLLAVNWVFMWGICILKLHESFQRGIERLFFSGKSTRASVYVAYVLGNTIVMLLIFYVLLDEIVLDWTGALHPVGSGISLLISGLDDAIPFVPEMAVFYVFVFGSMIIPTLLYFAFVEYKKGYAVGWSFVFIEVVAAIVYIIFPVSVYQYHEELLASPIGMNFWVGEVHNIVSDFGSTFNTFPSLRAAGSTVCAYTWYQYHKLNPRNATKVLVVVSVMAAVGIILSTLFIKQHYVLDEVAGILLGLGVSRPTFNHFWKPFWQSRSQSKNEVTRRGRRSDAA